MEKPVKHSNNKKRYHKGYHFHNNNSQKQEKKNHSKEPRKQKNNTHSIPKWEFDIRYKGKEISSSKAMIMEILEGIDKEELLMTPLVQKNKSLKSSKNNKKSSKSNNTEITPKVTIDTTQICPICNKTIRETLYALYDYDSDQLAHFDCVYRKVANLFKDKLPKGRHLAYLGSGSFGIMECVKNKASILIEKIYLGESLEKTEEEFNDIETPKEI